MNSERLRLFVALALPAEVRSELERWRPEVEGVRFVGVADLHVTLCFLGSVEAADAGDVLDACGVVAGMAPASLRLGDALWLPPRRPRVLAVGVDDVDGALAAVQARLSSALAAGGWYRPEARPFLSHVTVARVRRGARVRAMALEPPRPVAFTGDAVTVFRSRLSAGGARYEALGRVVLGRGA